MAATVKPTAALPSVALVAGASGLTGHALLRRLLREGDYARVVALSRRPLPLDHPRLANRILRFDALASSLKGLRCTDAFCALGAPGGPDAEEAALRAVDLELVIAFARAARTAGATRLVVVSSAGAAVSAAQPFLRIKGEMEAALRGVGFPSIDILQPGRVAGVRPGDGAGAMLREGLLLAASPLLRRVRGSLDVLSAEQLAGAMFAAARARRPGIRHYIGGALREAPRPLRRTG